MTLPERFRKPQLFDRGRVPPERARRRLGDWIASHRPSKILFLGCGTGVMEIGPVLAAMRRRRIPFEATAVDLSAPMLAVARRRFPKVRFFRADLNKDLRRLGSGYDAIVAFFVLQHVRSWRRLIDRLSRANPAATWFVTERIGGDSFSGTVNAARRGKRIRTLLGRFMGRYVRDLEELRRLPAPPEVDNYHMAPIFDCIRRRAPRHKRIRVSWPKPMTLRKVIRGIPMRKNGTFELGRGIDGPLLEGLRREFSRDLDRPLRLRETIGLNAFSPAD
jgi:hypothetical protein